MSSNGQFEIDRERELHLLRGAGSVDVAIPVLTKASHAILDAGRALESIAAKLSVIGTDTARAISDTTELKRYLKAITAREQKLREDFDAFRTTMMTRAPKKQDKKHKKRRRK